MCHSEDAPNVVELRRFLAKHADNDSLNLMYDSVPPADLSRVNIFRAALGKYEKQAQPAEWTVFVWLRAR